MAAAGERKLLCLELEPVVHVTDGIVRGEVHLDFLALQRTPLQEVAISLKGKDKIAITYPQGTTHTEVELPTQSQSLWTKGSVFPLPGEHVLRLPFCFTLPAALAHPSMLNLDNWKSSVEYVIRVVGKRPGLHVDKTIVRRVLVLSHDEHGVVLRRPSQDLEEDWAGPPPESDLPLDRKCFGLDRWEAEKKGKDDKD